MTTKTIPELIAYMDKAIDSISKQTGMTQAALLSLIPTIIHGAMILETPPEVFAAEALTNVMKNPMSPNWEWSRKYVEATKGGKA